MTQVFPISSAEQLKTTPEPKAPDDQFGKDTFLKLLVAQMKYQNPLAPKDGSEFLTQTAQFTQLETLQRIEKSQEALAQSTQMLAAASMVGRPVTYSLAAAGQPGAPIGTTIVSLRGTLPKDAASSGNTTATTDVFTRDGQKVALTLKFTKTIDGWSVQAAANGQTIGNGQLIKFDASGDRAITDVTLSAADLNKVSGTANMWPPNGLKLELGDADDPTRLHLASGPATVAIAEQNGNDGNTANGVVTGIHLTAQGPSLVIGGREVPFSAITDVKS
jgi:Flagellar hook capping protein - N-terminal region